MKCPYCGAENADTKRFCGDCGSLIAHPPVFVPHDGSSTILQPSAKLRRSHLLAIVAIVVALCIVASAEGVLLLNPTIGHKPHFELVDWSYGWNPYDDNLESFLVTVSNTGNAGGNVTILCEIWTAMGHYYGGSVITMNIGQTWKGNVYVAIPSSDNRVIVSAQCTLSDHI